MRRTIGLLLLITAATGLATSFAIGAEWSADLRLTEDAALSTEPDIAVDSDGNCHIVWIDSRGEPSGDKLYYTKLSPTTMSLVAAKALDVAFEARAPRAVVDPGGKVHVVWERRESSYGSGTREICYAQLSSGGELLAGPVRLTPDDGQPSQYPDVGVDGSGNVFVVWQDQRDNGIHNEVYFTRLDPSGNTVVDDLRLTDADGKNSESPRVAVDSVGYPHVVWQHATGDPPRWVIAYARLNGSGQVVRQRTLTSPDRCTRPSIAFQAPPNDPQLHIVWQTGVGGYSRELHYMVLDLAGDTIAGETSIAASSGQTLYPEICVGSAHVVWQDDRDGNPEVYYVEAGQQVQRLTEDAGQSCLPRTAVGKDRALYVVWQDDRYGNSEILLKTTATIPNPDDEITFEDPRLEQAVREAISKPSGAILKSDVRGLARLDAESRGIVSLEGIQFCTNLSWLNLRGNVIVSIGQLAALASLTHLDLAENVIVDVAALAGLTNLTWLRLWNNRVEQVDAVAGLTKLTYLSLTGNLLTTTAPLSGLVGLVELWVDRNQVASVDGLRNLTKLTNLDLTLNRIVDLSPLANLTGLRTLFVGGNPLQGGNLGPLAGLRNLLLLHAWSTGASDLRPLSGLVSLEELEVGENRVWSLDELAPLVRLRKLRAQGNLIQQIDVLVAMGLPEGASVDVRWNYLDLSPSSDDRQSISTLVQQGVIVQYDPQRSCQAGCWGVGLARLQVQGSGSDEEKAFGVAPDAQACRDALDVLDLPLSPSRQTTLWFAMEADCSDTQRYARDVRPPLECGTSEKWAAVVTDDGPEQLVTLRWNLGDLPVLGGFGDASNPQVTLRDLTAGQTIDMRDQAAYTYEKAANPETRALEITVDCGACHNECLDLHAAGWHMLTLPGALCGDCAAGEVGDLCCALCDELDPCYLFTWQPQAGSYVMVPPCGGINYQPGVGFWVRTYRDPVTVCTETEPAMETVCIRLGVGWNQIGNPFAFPVSLAHVTVRYRGSEVPLVQAEKNHWMSRYLQAYDTAAGVYRALDPTSGSLTSWTGYWVLAYVDCEVCVAAIPAPPSPPSSALAGSARSTTTGIPVPPSPPRLSAETEGLLDGLQVWNEPNPVRSEHTTTFKLRGEAAEIVEAMRVEIYDLAGKIVFSQEIAARELAWHTLTTEGELLANGVYLYQVWAKIGDTWYPTGIRKLAVYR